MPSLTYPKTQDLPTPVSLNIDPPIIDLRGSPRMTLFMIFHVLLFHFLQNHFVQSCPQSTYYYILHHRRLKLSAVSFLNRLLDHFSTQCFEPNLSKGLASLYLADLLFGGLPPKPEVTKEETGQLHSSTTCNGRYNTTTENTTRRCEWNCNFGMIFCPMHATVTPWRRDAATYE